MKPGTGRKLINVFEFKCEPWVKGDEVIGVELRFRDDRGGWLT